MMTMREFIDSNGVVWVIHEDGNGKSTSMLKEVWDEQQAAAAAVLASAPL